MLITNPCSFFYLFVLQQFFRRHITYNSKKYLFPNKWKEVWNKCKKEFIEDGKWSHQIVLWWFVYRNILWLFTNTNRSFDLELRWIHLALTLHHSSSSVEQHTKNWTECEIKNSASSSPSQICLWKGVNNWASNEHLLRHMLPICSHWSDKLKKL